MKKGVEQKPKKRVLATKKLVDPNKPEKYTPLQFRRVTDEELEANRNSAYKYLIG